MAETSRKRLQHVLLFVLMVSNEAGHVCGVWPLPQRIVQSPEIYSLNPQFFTFGYTEDSAAQSGCSVLDAAFKTYFNIMFTDFTYGKGK